MNKNYCLIHVPKTGGTTLDFILHGELHSGNVLRNITSESSIDAFRLLMVGSFDYLSGHVPSASIDLAVYKSRITIIRDPREIIASTISFSNLTGYKNPTLSSAIAGSSKYEVYGSYFSPRFQLERFIVEKRYGAGNAYRSYLGSFELADALAQLKKFNVVIDFRRLDESIKKLIVKENFFPFRNLPVKRRYTYSPDLDAANRLLSDFDVKFYDAAKQYFMDCADVASAYEEYRLAYCHAKGVTLNPGEELAVDLRNPLGVGWYDFEYSESGKCYRWSEAERSTIELPMSIPGKYEISIYIQQTDDVSRIDATFLDAGSFKYRSLRIIDLPLAKVIRVSVDLLAPSWVDIGISVEKNSHVGSNEGAVDHRALGVRLGDIYVVRHE